jgi:NADPH:quinone reductase
VKLSNAIVQTAFGGPEVLEWREAAGGEPGPGEVAIRHTAIGVNYIDIYVRDINVHSGAYKMMALPGSPGMEAAGIVEEVGPGVEHVAVGNGWPT